MAMLALPLPSFNHCLLYFCYFLPKTTLIVLMLQISFNLAGLCIITAGNQCGKGTQFVELMNIYIYRQFLNRKFFMPYCRQRISCLVGMALGKVTAATIAGGFVGKVCYKLMVWLSACGD